MCSGFTRSSQIEGWIPIFLFAMLFGLSMDYEVFLVTPHARGVGRRRTTTTRAVALGLERTGRIVTAAAIIMVAAFSGFIAGRIVGLQEFGARPRGRDLPRRDARARACSVPR